MFIKYIVTGVKYLLLQTSISLGYQTISSVSLSQMHWEYWTVKKHTWF